MLKRLLTQIDRDGARLESARAGVESVEQIKGGILLRRDLTQLSPEERLICIWKKAGFSIQEIAHRHGRSVAAVDALLSRAKQKIRGILGVESEDGEGDKLARASNAQLAERRPLTEGAAEDQIGRNGESPRSE